MSDAPHKISDSEYAAIEQAVMESPRGRQFLARYAERARAADTQSVIAAIERLYHTAIKTKESAQLELLYHELQDIRTTLRQERRKIIAIDPNAPLAREQVEINLETLSEKVQSASNDIYVSCERLRDINEMLRAAGTEADICDEIETHAAGIYMSCAFVALTSEQTGHLMDVMDELDAYLVHMLEIWDRDELLNLHAPMMDSATA
ncbi:MAG: hypothetical protein WBN97_01615 [Parvibaculum sp.]